MIHGGDIYRNQVELDFSVNLNPLPIPDTVRQAVQQAVKKMDAYPDLTVSFLRQGIAEHFQLQEEQILCGNGASELFMAIVHAFRPRRILIPVPSFYGYQWAAQAVDAKVRFYPLKQESDFAMDWGILDELEDSNMIFLANPNNPTGSYIEDALLTEILKRCRDKKMIVVLDECFMELSAEPEMHTRIPDCHRWQNVFIVRAFTKSYAIPGIRLGYLIGGDAAALANIRRQLPEWNVSLLAQEAGKAALQEPDYLPQARQVLETERKYLTGELKQNGITVYPSQANYLLVYMEQPFYQKLLEAKILIRDCSQDRGLGEGYYRIAVKDHEDNVRLVQELTRISRNAVTPSI